jgi:hypothetical protein
MPNEGRTTRLDGLKPVRHLIISIVAGSLAGAVAAGVFLAVHALVIVPIWWSSLGAWKAIVAGAMIGGALQIVLQRPLQMREAFWVGLFLWFACLVPNACVHLMRLARVPEPFEVAVGLASNIVLGAAMAYRIRRTPLAALAGIVGAMVMLVMEGPFDVLVTAGAVTRLNVRAATLLAGLLAVDVAFGAALALGAGLMAHLLPQKRPQEV